MKFGGTSVGSPSALQQSAAIVKKYEQEWEHVVVVVSAMTGVTDMLLTAAENAERGDEASYTAVIDALHLRHTETINAMILNSSDRENLHNQISQLMDDLRTYCRSIQVMGEITPRGLDTIAPLGERMNARLFSTLLNQANVASQPVEASSLIITDANFTNAMPIMDLTRERVKEKLMPVLDQGITPVVTGFTGATEKGVLTTLGRGGSDFTAAILGDCLNAQEVWTWTDVNGVMTADPRIVPEA